MKTLNKTDMIEHIAEMADLTKASAKRALEALLEGITEALTDGNQVTFVGFGTFKTADRKAREGRNPLTGAKIRIPAKKVPLFKAGKQLKDEVAG
ncbi:MAG: HU family DNA-binding protein [Gammaproteobacteria bacterium]|nr:HU family DNA-binding protein [Gammaproteobacteria bacterium]